MSKQEALSLLRRGEVIDWDYTVGGRAVWIAVRANGSGDAARILGDKR